MRRGTASHRAYVVAAAALLTATACDGEQSATTSAVTGLPEYVVSVTPSIVIDDDGTPERAFSGALPRQMPDGSIAIGDRGSSEIHTFGRSGNHLQRLARRGNGPGELRGDFLLTSRADTLFVMTRPPAPPDLSTFTPADGFLSRTRLHSTDAPAGLTMVDRLESGQVIVERGTGFSVLQRAPIPGVIAADSVRYGILRQRADGEGGEIVWLPTVRREWTVTFPWPNGPIPASVAPYLLGPETAAAVSADLFWLVDAENGWVRAFDRTGSQVVSTRLPLRHQPIDLHALERQRDRALASVGGPLARSRVMAQYDPEMMPDAAPLISAAHAGIDGELWVRIFDLDEAAPQRFLVLDRKGAVMAQATLPPGLAVHQIGADFVLGVRRDSLGVESVLEFSLRRK